MEKVKINLNKAMVSIIDTIIDGISYGLLVYIYHFLFGLALKSDLLIVTVILSSPLRFYLTFKWIWKEKK